MSFIKKITSKIAISALVLSAALTSAPQSAQAQAEPFVGQISIFGTSWCPRGWAPADGALLPINQNTALFSLLGTTYGGDGRTSFGLPDLRGRAPIHYGHGPGLYNYPLGSRGGAETHTMTVGEMPSHNHMVNANNGVNGYADRLGPGNDFLGSPSYNDPTNPAEDIMIYADQTPNVQMDPRMIEHTGGNQAFHIRGPFLAMNYCIALFGIYPSRN